MTFRVALLFVVLAVLEACGESVPVPVPAPDAGRDGATSAPQERETIRSISEEIDLSAAADRARGFRASARGLVAESAHRTVMSAEGVTMTFGGTPVTLAHASISVAGTQVLFGAPALDTEARAIREADSMREIVENGASTVEQSWRFATRPAGAVEVRVPIPGASLDHIDGAGLHLVRGNARFVYSHARLVDARSAVTDIPVTFEEGAAVMRISESLLALTAFPAVLDPTISAEVPVAPTLVRDTAVEDAPSVLMFGTRAVATWQASDQVRCNYADATDDAVMRATRVLKNDGTTLSNARSAVSGSVGIVVYRTPDGISYFRFDQSCSRLDATARTLFTGGTNGIDLSISVTPYSGGFIVTWTSSSSQRLARAIGLDGSVLWTAPTTLTDPLGDIRRPDLVVTDTDVIVVYRVNASARLVRAQRMTTGGLVTSIGPVTLDTGATSASFLDLRAVRTPASLVLVWDGGSATRTIASFELSTLAPVTAQTATVQAGPALARLAYDGTDLMLANVDSTDFRARLRRVDATTLLPIGSDIVATTPANSSSVQSIAAVPGTFVTAQSFGAEDRDVFLFRVAASTTELPLSWVVPSETNPVVASTGTGFMVSYVQTSPAPARLRAAYVSSAGVVSPPAGFDVPVAGTPAAAIGENDVSASSTHYLVSARTSTTTNGRLYVASATTGTEAYPSGLQLALRVASVRVGSALRTVFPSALSGGLQWRTAASPTNEGGSYMASVTASRPFAAANTLVAAAGTSAITLAPTSGSPSTLTAVASNVSLAYSGTDYLLSFTTSGGDLIARRVSDTGALLGSNIVLRTAAPGLSSLSSVWDGTRYIVAYVSNGALLAQRVSASGAIMDPSPGTLQMSASAGVPTDMAADASGNVLVVYGRDTVVQGVVTLRVFGRIVSFAVNGPDANGTACTSGWSCASGICADGVCCDRACGSALATCEACSIAAGGTVNGTCSSKAAGQTCRPQAGPCDVAEACTGSSAVCPVDGFASSGVCNPASGGACDADDVCDGTTAACPARIATAGTTCRASSDLCDVAETCNGTDTTCPADGFSTAGTSCRPATAGGCDVAETCNGTMKACPTDRFAASSTTCRAATRACDVAERCTGSSPTCPSDAPAHAGTFCRASAGPCDPVDTCDGVSFDCGTDVRHGTATVCRPAVSVCDVADRCNGFDTFCPTDVLAPAGTVCRASGGACDLEEACSGASSVCPTDRLRGFGATCRPAAGVCDLPELCTGLAKTCPGDSFRAAGSVCRDARGACDIAEACSGTSAECLADVHQADGISCDDGLVCNGASVCQSGACQPAEALECSSREVCSEVTGACIPEPSGGCAITRNEPSRPSDSMLLVIAALGLAVARRRHR